MKRAILFLMVVLILFPVSVFAQQGAAGVRDYVGLINQTYHPGIVEFFEKLKTEYERRGDNDAVRVLEIILSGGFGSGFLYNDARGNFYVLTNNHVIAQAHTLSITFERPDGTTRKIENLTIVATDEEEDLALLALPQGERPLVARGLTFLTRGVQEGEDAFSAGFPGLGRTPVWQFSRGMISNASARFPKSDFDDTMIGPFIQHTSQIDFGNSGGPLLITQANAPSGYAVAGMNTLSAISRQAANYAIPASKIQAFINSALNQRPDTFRAALDERLEKFVDGLGANAAVYPHIQEFLSSACVGENTIWAYEELSRRGSSSARNAFNRRARENIISAMGLAVAWTIEDSIRGTGAIRAQIKEVTGEGEEYTVVFTINNKDVSSVWVREHGNWRIKTFGTAATGEERANTRQNQRTQRSSSGGGGGGTSGIEAGYAYLFDKEPIHALYLNLDLSLFGFNFYVAGSDFWSLGMYIGGNFPIQAGDLTISPVIRGGMSIASKEVKDDFGFDFDMYLFLQGGLKIAHSALPVYLGVAYQYNFFFGFDEPPNPFNMGLSIVIGYSF